MCALHVLALIDDDSAATEPERLAHISLGQENPQMRMNAAPPVPRFCTGKLTHAARQFPHSGPPGEKASHFICR